MRNRFRNIRLPRPFNWDTLTQEQRRFAVFLAFGTDAPNLTWGDWAGLSAGMQFAMYDLGAEPAPVFNPVLKIHVEYGWEQVRLSD